ncbi:MAG: shikimate kinase [Candidatus Binatia bacterium]|nr:MAG: shikimate kinase [Candidatus Binatia bacterium]
MKRKAEFIALTGFMGTGKTAVGRALAERLGWKFVDTDTRIEEMEGSSVAEIFARKGELYFRRREREVVERLVGEKKVVVATGGGTIVDPRNRELLRAAGPLVCLRASPEEIERRTQGPERPLLEGAANRSERIRTLLAEREAAYAGADYHVDTNGLEVEQVVEKILELLREGGN